MPEPRVIGIDDWAFKKGFRYGTIVVDLERHRPIDLLPDRQMETVKQWLVQHPGIDFVARDRSKDYARAITAGAPQAIQVADRWHLLKNLTDALCKALNKYAKQLRQWAIHDQQMGQIETVDSPTLSTAKQEAQQYRRADRQERFKQTHQLHQLGWQQKEIAQHLGICPRTVRRYLAKETLPQAHRYRISKLDPYKAYHQDAAHTSRFCACT